MANRDNKPPDWLDPFGLWESMKSPSNRSLTWMVTKVVRQLEGRRVEIQRDPSISGRVARVHEVVPSTVLPIPGQSSSMALWDSARFTINDLMIGTGPIERVEVTADDVRIADFTAQRVSVASVDFVATLTDSQVAHWIREMGVEAEFDSASMTAMVRSRWLGRWFGLVVESTLGGRDAELRPIAVMLIRWTIPLPSWLARSRTHVFEHLPPGMELRDMSSSGDRSVEVRLVAHDLDLAIDLPRLVTDIGVEGTRSVVRILGVET